jgi:hypothetical protein
MAACLAAGGLGYVVKIRMGIDLIPAINEALVGRVFVSAFSIPQDSPSPCGNRQRSKLDIQRILVCSLRVDGSKREGFCGKFTQTKESSNDF